LSASALTLDALSDGALELYQHERGFRFGLDAVLLATELPALPSGGHVVDLGSGNGAVGLAIAARRADITVTLVERQPALFALIERNIEHNGLGERVGALHTDVRDRTELRAHSADLVVCNPPYHKEGTKRPSHSAERAAAMIELNGELGDFVRAACYVLKPRARLKLVVPPDRLPDLHRIVPETDFSFETMRFFHPSPGDDAYLVELVLRRSGRALPKVLSPLFIRDEEGTYTPEVQQRIASVAVQEGA
jgi:tRNA1Val (adenine37-N6)-methyltransferase